MISQRRYNLQCRFREIAALLFFTGKRMEREKTCCFIGHRHVDDRNGMKRKIKQCVEELIVKNGVDTFLFGSKSVFDDLALEAVTELKEKYPHITRVYVRSMYSYISEQYKEYLLTLTDETFMPAMVENAGRAAYVKRNQYMIDNSAYAVFYYDSKYAQNMSRKSGTKVAYEYAQKRAQALQIINLAND